MRVVLISVIFAVQPCPHTLGRRLGRAFASSSHCQPMGPKEHQARSPPLTLPKVNSRHKRAHPNPSKTIRNDQTRPKTRAMEKRSKTITQSPSRPEGPSKTVKKTIKQVLFTTVAQVAGPSPATSPSPAQVPAHFTPSGTRPAQRHTWRHICSACCERVAQQGRDHTPHSDTQGKSRLCPQREVTEQVIIVIVIEQ